MNWKEKIFGLPWEHKDPETRQQAIATLDDPRLLKALPKLARDDENAQIRSAAFNRISDLSLLHELLQTDSSKGNRQLLRQRIHQLLINHDYQQNSVSDRLALLEHWQDQSTFEHLAVYAKDTGLRARAIKAIGKQGLLGDIAINETDPQLRRLASSRVSQISTLERIARELRTKDKALHRQVNQRVQQLKLEAGDEAAIREAAGQLCEALDQLIRNSSDGNRKQALAELDKHWQSLGDNVPDALQHRFQRARENLLQALQPKAKPSDPLAAHSRRAESLLQQLQQLLKIQDFDRCQETLDKLERSWAVLPDTLLQSKPGGALGKRYLKTKQQINEHLSRLAESLEVNARLGKTWQTILQYTNKAGQQPRRKRVNQLITDWQFAWTHTQHPNPQEQALNDQVTAALAKLEDQVEALEAEQEQLLRKTADLLNHLDALLEHGDLAKARAARADLQQLLPKVSRDRRWQGPDYRGRLLQIQGKLRELRDWQHWSNNKIRKRLISEVEELPESGLHPDAILASMKAAQTQWKELEESEQLPGEKRFSASPWMWRKFNTVCHNAFETAKPFLEKRTEIQKRREQEMKNLVEKLLASAQETGSDWKSMQSKLQQARQEMRSLDEVRPSMRQAMAGKLRAAMDKVSKQLDRHYQEVEKQKLKLIREAEQLQYIDDQKEAMEQAKALQKRWQQAGSLWRSKDQKLWKEFRKPIDPIFHQAKQEQTAAREQLDSERAALSALCQQAQAIATLPDAELAAQAGRVAGLEAEWSNQSLRAPDLRQRFDQAVRQYRKRLQQAQQEQADSQRSQWRRKLLLCQQLETALHEANPGTAENWETKWQQATTGKTDNKVDKVLNKRWKKLFAAIDGKALPAAFKKDLDKRTESARGLCIQAEFLAGIESPEKEREQRMRYQVDRLSRTLGDASARKPVWEEAEQMEQEWYTTGNLVPEATAELQQRFDRALGEIKTQNN